MPSAGSIATSTRAGGHNTPTPTPPPLAHSLPDTLQHLALKLLIRFNLLQVVPGAVVEALSKLTCEDWCRQRVVVQTRHREVKLTSHRLPKRLYLLSIGGHASAKLLL